MYTFSLVSIFFFITEPNKIEGSVYCWVVLMKNCWVRSHERKAVADYAAERINRTKPSNVHRTECLFSIYLSRCSV